MTDDELVISEETYQQMRRRKLTPEEIAERRRYLAALAVDRDREHQSLLEDVPRGGLAEEMLILHAPSTDGACRGCDSDGYHLPEWPCRTYRATAARYRRRFVEDDSGSTLMERSS